ncbi:MAG: FtsQ-type POTRA domain-containing protein [Oscillospiraceae bacterium]|nr:FtsQ-type POTRA domain-containing protein [Oscillospiraceae bacterium]
MQNVKKIDIDKNQNGKRSRRRRRNFVGYYFIVIFLVVTIGVSLSVTLLFNINDIVVTGNTLYDSVEIIKATGIVKGDNLVRLNTEDAEKNILKKMLYVDDVKIKKGFPDKLYISLTPSVAMAYVQCQGGYMLISHGWRILDLTETPQDQSLLVINGFNPESTDRATKASSIDAGKNAILSQMLAQIDEQQMQNLISIDLSDKFNLKINYDNRITIVIGNSTDIKYKLKFANQLLTQTQELGENKKGYLIYHESHGYSFITEEEYNQINEKAANAAVSTEIFDASGTDVSSSSGTEITDTGNTSQPLTTDESAEDMPQQ